MNRNIIGNIILEEAGKPFESKVTEHRDGKPIAEGILQDVDHQNRNGRNYASTDLFPEIDAPRQKELIATGNMKGENGHPQCKDLSRQQTIDPDKVCVKYLDIWHDDKYVWGRYTGTNNDRGRDFDRDLLSGEKPSFSLRALGVIENVHGKAWVRNLKVITWDRVIYPSHSCAYTQRLIGESANLDYVKSVLEAADLTKMSPNRRELLEGSFGEVIPFDQDGVIKFIMAESSNVAVFMNNFDVFYESMSLNESATRLTMKDHSGNTYQVNLEKYVTNQIADYVVNKFGR